MTDVVTNTSPHQWLAKAGYLDLLSRIYDGVYVTPGVKKQIRDAFKTSQNLKLQAMGITPAYVDSLQIPDAAIKRRENLRKKSYTWKKKLNMNDRVDAEVFLVWKDYCNADEMLFANQNAQKKIGGVKKVREIATERGRTPVRDISELYEIAEEKRVFRNRVESITYIQALIRADYMVEEMQELLARLSS